MISKNKLYIFYSALSFLGVSILLFVIFSRLIAYFETPTVTVSSIQNNSIDHFYQPSFNWMPLKNEGRKMEEHSLEKITENYFGSFYGHNQYLSQGNSDGIHDYFTKKSYKKIEFASLSNQSDQTSRKVSYTTLSHELDLKLYSQDGAAIVFDDIQENYHQLFENDELVSGYYDIARFEVMLLLEDNFWRVRHKIRSNTDFKFKSVSKDTLNEYVTLKGKHFIYKDQPFKSKGINYYPAKYPWEDFWPNFNKIPLKEDFALIANAGFNTIRVFTPYHQFGGANVDQTNLANLEKLLNLADTYDLKVIVTLFDFFLDYSVDKWTLSDRHAETIVTRLNNHPAILSWDIKNEPDLDFKNYGEGIVKEWLKFMTMSVKKYDPNHLVTIGWSVPEYLTALDASVDYYSFHFYNDPSDLGNYLQQDFNKPLILEETGQHSFNAWWYPFRKSKEDQSNYTSKILDVITKYDLSYTFWTLYDFRNIPDNVVGAIHWRKGIQKNFGLINKNNKQKPAFKLIKEYNLNNKSSR